MISPTATLLLEAFSVILPKNSQQDKRNFTFTSKVKASIMSLALIEK
jgi:hypothetical protein